MRPPRVVLVIVMGLGMGLLIVQVIGATPWGSSSVHYKQRAAVCGEGWGGRGVASRIKYTALVADAFGGRGTKGVVRPGGDGSLDSGVVYTFYFIRFTSYFSRVAEFIKCRVGVAPTSGSVSGAGGRGRRRGPI